MGTLRIPDYTGRWVWRKETGLVGGNKEKVFTRKGTSQRVYQTLPIPRKSYEKRETLIVHNST